MRVDPEVLSFSIANYKIFLLTVIGFCFLFPFPSYSFITFLPSLFSFLHFLWIFPFTSKRLPEIARQARNFCSKKLEGGRGENLRTHPLMIFIPIPHVEVVLLLLPAPEVPGRRVKATVWKGGGGGRLLLPSVNTSMCIFTKAQGHQYW